MYNSGYFAANVEDATIVSQTYRSPVGSYDKDFLDKIKKMKDKGYGKSLLEKNSYVVRGGVIGGIAMIGLAIVLRKNIWGFAIIGIASGSVLGKFLGEKLTNKNKDGK